jgi:hypothetical protein
MGTQQERWRAGLLALLLLSEVGCTAGRAGMGPEGLGPGLREHSATSALVLTSGEGRVPVKRDAFVEAWMHEAGRCTRETALNVAVQTFGMGLLVLPPVCGLMTAALPGMTTHFVGGRMRRGIEGALASRDLHGTLRDRIGIVARESGRPVVAPADASHAGADVESAPEPDAIVEVTVTEIRVRDDDTLASVSARARVLRASDRMELGARVFTHQPPARTLWHLALEPALTDLATAIVAALAPASVTDRPGVDH